VAGEVGAVGEAFPAEAAPTSAEAAAPATMPTQVATGKVKRLPVENIA